MRLIKEGLWSEFIQIKTDPVSGRMTRIIPAANKIKILRKNFIN